MTMKRVLLTTAGAVFALAALAQPHTEVTIAIDTKLMFNVDCNLLGDGAGGPAQVNKVYMHSGACSENRGNDPQQSAHDYCADQIVPYASDVWQHVVGNWGQAPQDDGVGQMDDLGNGVYSKTFVMEDYYSDPNLVNNEINSTGTTQSAPLDPNNPIYLIGLVFRNEDGSASGRDQQGCQDIFIINVDTENPTVINSTDNSTCNYVTFTKNSVGIVEQDLAYDVFVGPNPARDNISVRVSIVQDLPNSTLEVVNMLGQVVHSETRDLLLGTNYMTFDASTMANGFYTLSIRSPKGVVTQQKLVVSH
ncbi:MAG: T9SS type A sorting domain-containing protein [Flavobacteriales bacterium]|nr:T9SS type A sorting domain-containing protein [Flavobacteriales bacterium]